MAKSLCLGEQKNIKLAEMTRVCYPSKYMRKVVSAILLSGMVWGSTVWAMHRPCVVEVHGAPYGFTFLVQPPQVLTTSWMTVSGRSYAFELPAIANSIPLMGKPPIYLRGSTIVRGQYDFDNFEKRYRELGTYKVGQLYIALLQRLGALIAHLNKDSAEEYFTLMVLNRKSWHEVPLHHLALYTASQLVSPLPSLSDFFAIQRQNGNNRVKTEREFFQLILTALDNLHPQLLGTLDPLAHVLDRVRDENRFQILSEDRGLRLEDRAELFEFEARLNPTESEPLEFEITVEKYGNSPLWDEYRAPFLFLDFAQYDDYLELFQHQTGLLAHVSGPRTLVPSHLWQESDFDDGEEPYFYASSMAAIELTPQQAALFLDFVRQFRNFGLELIPM
ncbi:MAG: hypothetical protein R3B54_01285 [Bdellovibrionota bacterium]